MMQTRYMLEMLYGQNTAKVVLVGKLMGLAHQLTGRFVTMGRFGGGTANVHGLVEQVWRRVFEKQVFYNLLLYQKDRDSARSVKEHVGTNVQVISHPKFD
jgi:hypothetical protein